MNFNNIGLTPSGSSFSLSKFTKSNKNNFDGPKFGNKLEEDTVDFSATKDFSKSSLADKVNLALNMEKDLKEGYAEDFYDEVDTAFKKAKSGEPLNDDEKYILDKLGFNHPLFELFDNDLKKQFFDLGHKDDTVSALLSPDEAPSFYSKGLNLLSDDMDYFIAMKLFEYMYGDDDGQKFCDTMGEDFSKIFDIAINDPETSSVDAVPNMMSWIGEVDPVSDLDEKGMPVAKAIREDGSENKELSRMFSGLPGSFASLQNLFVEKYGDDLKKVEKDVAALASVL